MKAAQREIRLLEAKLQALRAETRKLEVKAGPEAIAKRKAELETELSRFGVRVTSRGPELVVTLAGTVVFDAHQRPVQRDAVDERLGAVDGVEDPAESAGAGPLGQLLAQDGVLGKGLGDAASEVLFGLPIGHRDRRVVCFALDLEIIPAEMLQGNPAGLPGRLDRQFQPPGGFWCGCIHTAKVAYDRGLGKEGGGRRAVS